MSSLADAKHFRKMELNLIKHFPLQLALYLDIALAPPFQSAYNVSYFFWEH